jgi:hypothetical protein
LPEIVVQVPLPSLLTAVTIAPTSGAFVEFLTTPAMAPKAACVWFVAAAGTESSALAVPTIPVRAVSMQKAGTILAVYDRKDVFIKFV